MSIDDMRRSINKFFKSTKSRFLNKYSWNSLSLNTPDDTLIIIKHSENKLEVKVHIIGDDNYHSISFSLSEYYKKLFLNYLDLEDSTRKNINNILKKNNLYDNIIAIIISYYENDNERLFRLIDQKCNSLVDLLHLLKKYKIKYIINY